MEKIEILVCLIITSGLISMFAGEICVFLFQGRQIWKPRARSNADYLVRRIRFEDMPTRLSPTEVASANWYRYRS